MKRPYGITFEIGCKKAFVNEWQLILFNDPAVESIPANADDFIALVIARDDYKNWKDRDTQAG